MPATNPTTALRANWPRLTRQDRVTAFAALPGADAEELLLGLDVSEQAELLQALPLTERRLWMRALPPDDAVDCLQAAGPDGRAALLQVLDESDQGEMKALLAYAEDDAGGLMNPRFARVRPDMRIDEALSYLRRPARARVAPLY